MDSHLPPGHEPGRLSRHEPPPRYRRRELEGVALAARRIELRRGEAVEVTVRGEPGAPAEGMRLGLVCRERFYESRGEGGPLLVTETAWEEWRPLGGDGIGSRAAFAIPRDAPYSYEGETIAFWWSIVADRPRRLLGGACRELPIWVSP